MTLLDCSGRSVGLPDEQMGNSEVEHIHIGNDRYVPQDFSKINAAIEDGSFFTNPVLCHSVDLAKAKGKALHLIGLLSPGSVHSHEEQIMAMIELTSKRSLSNIYMHASPDVLDVPPTSAGASIGLLEAKILKKPAEMTGRSLINTA